VNVRKTHSAGLQDVGIRWQWVTLFDPWPATHDYSRVMTPDYCSFQSGPLSGSALKIKRHHCHKIHRRNKWIKLTLWLKLCRKSLQCLKEDEIMGRRVTSTNPGPRDPLRFVDPLDPWPADPLSSLVGIISSSSRLLLLLVLIVTFIACVYAPTFLFSVCRRENCTFLTSDNVFVSRFPTIMSTF